MIPCTASCRWGFFLRLGELRVTIGSIHMPVRTSGVDLLKRALGELLALSARLACRADPLIIMGDTNNEFNMHVSDGAVIGPCVSPSHAPDACASRVAQCFFGARRLL